MNHPSIRAGILLSLFLVTAFGCGASGGGTGTDSSAPSTNVALDEFSVTPVEDAEELCPDLVPGPPVGLSCLHCGEPVASQQAFKLAEIMARSCRSHLATTMLVDGTFDETPNQLGEVVKRLTAGGSTLHLYLYFSNGPWQRRIGSVPPNKGIGTDYPPEEFRRRIETDSGLQNRYIERINWALPLIRYAQSRGAIVYLIPMLEDNFDAAAARSIERLFAANVPQDVPVAFGRNPCPACWPGNDDSVPSGMIRDVHLSSAKAVSVSGGLVSNDGLNLVFPGETKEGRSIDFNELRTVLAQSVAQGNSFIVWHRPYQGVGPDNVFLDPAERFYAMPSAAEEVELTEILSTQW